MLKIRVRFRFPKRVLKKPRYNFSVLPVPFCKAGKRFFLHMPHIDLGENVKTNCDLVNESTERSLQTKKKWMLIKKHWYKFE